MRARNEVPLLLDPSDLHFCNSLAGDFHSSNEVLIDAEIVFSVNGRELGDTE